nr:hypothetical protein [Brevundimonas diminuta]
MRPTLAILKWRKAERAAPGYVPPQAELTAARRAVGLEILLLVPLLAFAAAMARWPF